MYGINTLNIVGLIKIKKYRLLLFKKHETMKKEKEKVHEVAHKQIISHSSESLLLTRSSKCRIQ